MEKEIKKSDGKITLEEKQKWSLEQKVVHLWNTFELFYNTLDGKVYIAFSGGKDSTLLVFLIDMFCRMNKMPLVPLVFNNTTNEYQEILEFVKTYGDRVTWLRPKITFAQSLQKNGFPLVSKEQAQRISEAKNTKSEYLRNLRLNGVVRKSKTTGREYVSGKISEKWKYLVYEDIEVTSKCCDVLKKQPVKKYEKETGLSAIIGVTADESNLRKQQYNKVGTCNTFGKRNISKPLSIFIEKDIWDLIDKYKVPICSIYYDMEINGEIVKGEDRTGCAYCGIAVQYEEEGKTKFHRLQKREPKRFLSFIRKLGYGKALKLVGVEFDSERYVGQFVLTPLGKAEIISIMEDIHATVNLKLENGNTFNEMYSSVINYPVI
jgi:3'-phosphoadenosine 5'-phosphosulfate sulfotransferase (PAPS reductase)/FAD synthetase